ncbi:hypothetical protein FQZ97_1204830 [compost metagenome]
MDLATAAEVADVLSRLRVVSRQTIALLCGSPASIELFSRRLYLAGVPRSQMLVDAFLPHA